MTDLFSFEMFILEAFRSLDLFFELIFVIFCLIFARCIEKEEGNIYILMSL